MDSKDYQTEEKETLKPETANEEQEAGKTGEEASGERSAEQQLEDVHAEIEDLKDKYLRLSAEFDNYRKRTLKEKAELIKSGGEKVIFSILPVLDDLERGMQNMETSEDIAALKEGVGLIYTKFLKILHENGAEKIATDEKDFDTDFHEAVALVPAPTEGQKGKILDCVQNGYTLNEKVIRHAKVVVGQ